MFCIKCGYQNAPGTAFCARCGAPLNTAPQQPQYRPVQPVQPNLASPSNPGIGLGIPAMIVGIASLVFFCIFYISLPAAIVSIILGANGLAKSKKVGMGNGMATAGIICSSIALALTITLFIIIMAEFDDFTEFFEEVYEELFEDSYYYDYY